jgi:hypothetical protein
MDAPENYDIQAVLESKTWTFAKTMPHNPHYWTLLKTWGDRDDFFRAVQYIKDHGVIKTFGRTDYIVFYVNGWRYWTMEQAAEDSSLMNRAVVDKTDPPEFWLSEGDVSDV